jgi:hypothetical protein
MDDKNNIDQDGFILVKSKKKNTENRVAIYGEMRGAAQEKSGKIVSWSLP